jgi:hypothetical protein
MGSSERSKVTQQQEEPAIVSVTVALFAEPRTFRDTMSGRGLPCKPQWKVAEKP